MGSLLYSFRADDFLKGPHGNVSQVHAPLPRLDPVYDYEVLVGTVGVLGSNIGHSFDGLHIFSSMFYAQSHVHVFQFEEVHVQSGVEYERKQVAAEEVRRPEAERRVVITGTELNASFLIRYFNA